MPGSSLTSLAWREAGFDEVCHELRTPLMGIRERAQRVERAILLSTALPEAERVRVLRSLAAIDAAVLGIVELIDDTSPSHLSGNTGATTSLVRPRSS